MTRSQVGSNTESEADMGYKASAPTRINCPNIEVPGRAGMTARVRLGHETCNKRFKKWNILKAAYRHDVLDHQAIFGAITCLTQISFANREPLFPVTHEG